MDRSRVVHVSLCGFRPARSSTDRVVAGVAAGLAQQLGVDPVLIRLAFVVLAFAGGLGLALYLLGWLFGSVVADPGAHPSTKGRLASVGKQVVAVSLIMGGALLLLREAGLWFGDGLVLSVALASLGSAVIWTRGDGSGRAKERRARRFPRLPLGLLRTRTLPPVRVVAGGLLIVGGMITFLAANDALTAARNVAFAAVVTATGIALVLGPWMWRLGRQLAEERRERIRSQERAEVAAHLHDSVLQTLALIQRVGEPKVMASLARGQERELRSWLYGRTKPEGGSGRDLLSFALDQLAERVERLHEVSVEVVAVGDCPLDERLRALVDAAGEAMNNAAKHSGSALVSVYSEVEPDVVQVYVRDEGRGFQVRDVPGDRRGIAESIVGRMERHGGAATVASERRNGTEVQLRMPRSAP